MKSGLFSWWIRELSEFFTYRRSRAPSWRTLLLETTEGLEIFVRKGRECLRLGKLDPASSEDQVAELRAKLSRNRSTSSRQVLLRMSSENVLRRTVQIPKAAQDVIKPVLANQMQQFVPWRESQTRFGYEVIGPNESAPDLLDINVVATSQAMLDGALENAARLGLKPYAVDFASSPDENFGVLLRSLEPDPLEKTATRLRRALAILLVLSIMSGGAGLFGMFNRQRLNDEVDLQLSNTIARIKEIRRLSGEDAEVLRQRQRLVEQKKNEPAVVVLIEALSRALPDNAYLSELEIHGRDVRIVGSSNDAAPLIDKLESTSQFGTVRFSAPITRKAGKGAETFSIAAQALTGKLLEN